MAAKSMSSFVPAAMRKRENEMGDLGAVLAPFLAAEGASLEMALGYIAGAKDYRERIEHADSKVFKGVLKRVETLERRRSSGSVLGKKLKLVFMAENSKGAMEEQDIDTSWVEYSGFDAEAQSFYIALSRTIGEIANGAIGKECFFRKAFFTDVPGLPEGANRVRFAADLDVKNSGAPAGGAAGGVQDAGERQNEPGRQGAVEHRAARRAGKASVEDLVVRAKAMRIKITDFDDDLLDDLITVINDHLTVAEMEEDLAKVLRVSRGKLLKALPEDPASPMDAVIVATDTLLV